MGFTYPKLKALPPDLNIDLLVIAGEHSGDEQAARLLTQLKKNHPQLKIAAFGGPALAKSGAQLIYDMTSSSVVGFWEVIKHYPFFKALFKEALQWIGYNRPKAILFVDYPGFNLRLANALYKKGLAKKAGGSISLFYYIAPQIWAWKAKRRFKMAHVLDALAVIFPFEQECFNDTQLPVHFVGHPFMDPSYQIPLAYDSQAPLLLLPGSRKAAVKRIFPLMLKGLESALKRHPQLKANILYPSTLIYEILVEGLSHYPLLKAHCRLINKETSPRLSASAVLTSSGTMSLNCALAGIPGAIVYRAAPMTYYLGRLLIKVPFLGISNILLKYPFYPEYIQAKANPSALADEITACLQDPERLKKTQEGAALLKRSLHSESEYSNAALWLGAQLNS